MNRQRIIDDLFHPDAKPWQVAPRPGSPFYHQRLGQQFTEFEPKKAARLLEETGLRLDRETGRRLLATGQPLEIEMLMMDPRNPLWDRIVDRISEDWAALGVGLVTKCMSRADGYQYVDQNQHDAAVYKGAGGVSAVPEPDYYVPVTVSNGDQSAFALRWTRSLHPPS
jgi:peptide/nickel transport system substrate-binding protein